MNPTGQLWLKALIRILRKLNMAISYNQRDVGLFLKLIGISFSFIFIIGAVSQPQLMDNNNGTITDQQLGLMWAKCSLGQTPIHCNGDSLLIKNWHEVELAIESSTLAGYKDWRLPSSQEFQKFKKDDAKFPNTPQFIFWTSMDESDPLLYFGHTDFGKPIRLVRDLK